MSFQIKTLTGKFISFNFEKSQSIFEIKMALQEKEGIPVESIRLIYGGKQLQFTIRVNEKSLQDYNLVGSTIYMFMQLGGGKL